MTSAPHRLRRWLLLPALGVAALALVACNGEDAGGTPGSGSTGTTTATEAATKAPFLARSPSDLASYRYRVDVTVAAAALQDGDAPADLPIEGDLSFNVDGAVVNPDREQTATSIDLGILTLTTETIRIGDQEWTRAGEGAWSPSTPSTGGDDLLDVDISPAALFTSSEDFDYEALTERLEEQEWQEEEANGLPTRHYTFTEEEFYRVFQTEDAILPPDIDATFLADIWLARERGVPVRLLILGTDGSGTEILRLEMNMMDLDAEILIEPPVAS
ncbi:MAG: hypothetical protein M0R73_12575 [Dehalococcoidia bacterium]|nr:hypothetical protein [Dehalococcoidia bacterium]